MKNLDKLINAIKDDYTRFQKSYGSADAEKQKHLNEMKERFVSSIKVIQGVKYTKIAVNGSVWGFIVNTTDDKKFQYGDMLKPASWRSPARNYARGNMSSFVADRIQWTGCY